MKTCPDCGSRVYSLGCVNCEEANYIEEQKQLTELQYPQDVNPFDERRFEMRSCDDGICECGHCACHHANENVQPNCCECRCSGFVKEPEVVDAN